MQALAENMQSTYQLAQIFFYLWSAVAVVYLAKNGYGVYRRLLAADDKN